MIAAYIQTAGAVMFLSEKFRSPAGNFYNSEEVELDIERSDEEVAIVVTDISTGYRMNATDIYTNKSFKAPVLKEGITLNSFELIKRMVGQDPFQDPGFRANIMTQMFKGMAKVESKIRRTIELQAAQILQTGVVTLIDENGVAVYTIDFKPKSTHFPIAGTPWDAVGGDPIADLSALFEIVRNDGLADVDETIWGIDAFEAAMKVTTFRERFDTRRADQGTIVQMQQKANGGIFRGTIDIGNYKLDVWTYGGRYNHPQTGAKTQYLDPAKVVVRASSGRMDATFGAIPNIGLLMGKQSTNLFPELPSRISNGAGGMDLHTNVWLSNNGEELFGGVGGRPLLIPTAIDTYGCIDSGV
jgi:hypothetical protein